MFNSDTINQAPTIKFTFLSYLLLGTTDTVHHFHAAAILGHDNAIYAAMVGVILVPTAIMMVILHAHTGNQKLLWMFLAIAVLAIAIPGFYHGGWNHLVKVLAHLRIDSPATDIAALFPAENFNLWFYEITGLLEFIFAIVCAYFVFKLTTKSPALDNKLCN